MTQAISRFRTAIAFLLVVGLVAPSVAFAVEGTRDQKEKRMGSTTPMGLGGQNFCANVDRFASMITEHMGKKEDNKMEKRDERGDKLEEHRGLKDGKLDDRRGDRDENRTMRYDKLYTRATTTAQTAAVDAFKATVESAVATRRAAVDAAITAFRTGTDGLIADRKAKVDAAWATLKTTVDAAVAKAKADCAGGVDSKTVRQTLIDSIKAANETFRTTIKPVSDAGDKVKTLRVTRDAAVKAAMDAFKVAFDAALAALKATLGH